MSYNCSITMNRRQLVRSRLKASLKRRKRAERGERRERKKSQRRKSRSGIPSTRRQHKSSTMPATRRASRRQILSLNPPHTQPSQRQLSSKICNRRPTKSMTHCRISKIAMTTMSSNPSCESEIWVHVALDELWHMFSLKKRAVSTRAFSTYTL